MSSETGTLEVLEIRRIIERLKAMIRMVVVGQAEVVEGLMVGRRALERPCWRAPSPAAWGCHSTGSSSPRI
jgi:hypothetical protein